MSSFGGFKKPDDEFCLLNSDELKIEATDELDVIIPYKNDEQLIKDESGMYRCVVCHKTFSDKKKWRQHARCHSQKKIEYTKRRYEKLRSLPDIKEQRKRVSCNKCDFKAQNHEQLVSHKRRIHSENLPFKYSCRSCDYNADRKFAYDAHVKNNHTIQPTTTYRCPFCELTSSDKGQIPKHIRITHDQIIDKSCKYCDFKSHKKGVVDIHIKVVHDKIKDIDCPYCALKFGAKSDLSSHIDRSHNPDKEYFWCEVENCSYKTQTMVALNSHSIAHAKIKRFKCDSCEYMHYNRSGITRHQSVHSTLLQFKCDICEKMFKTHQCMQHHLKGAHPIGSKVECKLCSEKFESGNKLQYHIKKKHNKWQPTFADCERCGKKIRLENLQKHIKEVHEKIKPFACEFCPKRFSQKTSQKRHQASYHLPTKKDVYSSDVYLNECKTKSCQLSHEKNINFDWKLTRCTSVVRISDFIKTAINKLELD